MDDDTTTDLSEFNSSQIWQLRELLWAWESQGLPEDFFRGGVIPTLNKTTGDVFLTNTKSQMAMLNGERLEMFYICPHCDHEGFEHDCKFSMAIDFANHLRKFNMIRNGN